MRGGSCSLDLSENHRTTTQKVQLAFLKFQKQHIQHTEATQNNIQKASDVAETK